MRVEPLLQRGVSVAACGPAKALTRAGATHSWSSREEPYLGHKN